jgi:FecR protein
MNRPIVRNTMWGTGMVLAFWPVLTAFAQEAAAPQAGPVPQKIVVESVRGAARFGRSGQFRDLTTDSQPSQGDSIVLEAGAVCKLQFQNATTGAVLAAVVVRGYTELTVAEAYQRGEQSRTQLDVPQGNLSVGVKRTTTPPSFNVRTPRVVVGVRGTEIHWFVVTPDAMGDFVRVGSAGVITARDLWSRQFSMGPGQGTWARNGGDARNNPLMRPIDFNQYVDRVLLSGPWRDGLEPYYDLYLFEPILLNPGSQGDSAGDPGYDRRRNAGEPFTIKGPPCCDNPPKRGGK